jgi:uncharacterized membrane protein YqjE
VDAPPDHKPGLFASVKRLLRTILAIAQNRLELLQLELREERGRLFEALLLAGAVLILALMTLMVATVTLVVVCVSHHQLGWVIALGLFYLLATLACYWRLRSRLKTWIPFAGTVAELKKDKTCLDDKNETS